MSKFFRSGNSTSSSTSESSDAADDEDDATQEIALQPLEAVPAGTASRTTAAVAAVPPHSNHHRDFLLHALLEERCVNEVLASYGAHPPQRDAPEVQAEANRRYARLCERLASYNLISTGLEEDRHAATRQRYRDGLDLLGQQQSSSAATTVTPALRRLLTEPGLQFSDLPVVPLNASSFSEAAFVPHPLRRLLTAPESYHGGPYDIDSANLRRSLPNGRFDQDFEQFGTIGSGGYGIVHKVKHRLDGRAYAVKKVPLSAARLQRIHERGQPELDKVLKEIRTLASLDHPNIVRYFNGWIEWVHKQAPDRFTPAVDDQSDQTVAGAESSASRAVLFQDSSSSGRDASQPVRKSIREGSSSTSADQDFAHHSPSETMHDLSNGLGLMRVGTKTTNATVTDYETTESVERTLDSSFTMHSSTGVVTFKESTFALHMQMSLHPMTLDTFLAPGSSSGSSSTHCYHLDPATSILLPVLDGLSYLHTQGIVHRDIKPGNIFLGPNNIAHGKLPCASCSGANLTSMPKLEVRIGDFGLVSVADPDAVVDPEAAQRIHSVGTKTYLPPPGKDIFGPALDVYALGIVAFELLCKFDSMSERAEKIANLKLERFPDTFCCDVHRDRREDVQDCILAMLGSKNQQPTVETVRQMVLELQSTDHA